MGASRVPEVSRESRKSRPNVRNPPAVFRKFRVKAGSRQVMLRVFGPEPGLVVLIPEACAKTGSRDETWETCRSYPGSSARNPEVEAKGKQAACRVPRGLREHRKSARAGLWNASTLGAATKDPSFYVANPPFLEVVPLPLREHQKPASNTAGVWAGRVFDWFPEVRARTGSREETRIIRPSYSGSSTRKPEVERKRRQSAGRVPEALCENRKSASNTQGTRAGSGVLCLVLEFGVKAGSRDKT